MKPDQIQEKSLLKALATPLALPLIIGAGIFGGATTIALPVYLVAAEVAVAHAQDVNTPRDPTAAMVDTIAGKPAQAIPRT